MPENISDILKKYHTDLHSLLKSKLSAMILYGSYARGNFTKDSDVDIMILLDAEQGEISKYADSIYDLTYDLEEETGMEINPVIQSVKIYNHWKQTYPFFINVDKEGIRI